MPLISGHSFEVPNGVSELAIAVMCVTTTLSWHRQLGKVDLFVGADWLLSTRGRRGWSGVALSSFIRL